MIDLEELSKQINKIVNNRADEEAILNILHAKLCNLFNFKGVTFNSTNNLKIAYPMSYFAFNFVPSGGCKDLLLTEIDRNLLGFFDKELEDFNNARFSALQKEHRTKESEAFADATKLKKVQQENKQEERMFYEFINDITSSTQSNMYDMFAIIDEYKKGSVLLTNTEFANYYEDVAYRKDLNKKEFIDMFYKLFDGIYTPSSSTSTRRKKLKDLPITSIFMSDYKLLLRDATICKKFKEWFEQGMARRSFVYFRRDSKHISAKTIVPASEKEKAYKILEGYALEINNLYFHMPEHKHFSFSEEANNLIDQFTIACGEKSDEFFKFTDNLDLDNGILNVNIVNAPWKVIKLAVLYQILDDYESKCVTSKNVQKAIDYFWKMHTCLHELINVNITTDTEKLYSYLILNVNKWVNKTQLNEQKFVDKNIFSKWYENDAIPMLSEIAIKKNLGLVERTTGKTNRGREICLFNPELYKFVETFRDDEKKILKGELQKVNIEINYTDSLD